MFRYLLFTEVSNKPNSFCRVRKLPDDFCENLPMETNLWNESMPSYWEHPDSVLKEKLDSLLPEKPTIGECTKFRYSDEFYGKTGVTEFDWVCEEGKNVEKLQIAVMIGVFWGSPLFGWTSDNYGRKLTLCMCFRQGSRLLFRSLFFKLFYLSEISS